jgi:2'-5' RNA ligase
MNNLFVAVVPEGLKTNPELKQLLGKMKRTLADKDVEARWTSPDLWHITIQFLGPLPEERRKELLQVMPRWRPDLQNLTLRLHGVGGFPTLEQARVLWLGVQENRQLQELRAGLGAFLRAQGFPSDEREFHPHLTLARLRNPRSIHDLAGLGGRKYFGDYPVREFFVMHSVVQGNMIKYLPLLRLNGSDPVLRE